MVDDLLAGNVRFREGVFQRDSERFRSLTRGQNPRVLWIGCSDSRVPVNLITDTSAGDLFVHRNIGNIVAVSDWNLGAVIEYSVLHLRIPDIVICGHDRCGAMQALETDTSNCKYLPIWLQQAQRARERADEQLGDLGNADPATRSRLIVEENVRLQLDHLQEYCVVRKAMSVGTLTLHGWVYVLASGEIKVLESRGNPS